ncbi:hypothetical protein QLX67_10855 [Balneolaceae bacterium ANBcel3]|nr:hypothetical protein [Balneolaceae bacterium ANBcel3]
MKKINQLENLSESDLKNYNGGFLPAVAAGVAIYVASLKVTEYIGYYHAMKECGCNN